MGGLGGEVRLWVLWWWGCGIMWFDVLLLWWDVDGLVRSLFGILVGGWDRG